MSAFGTGLAGLVGGLVLLMSLFSFCQRQWRMGCVWFLSGIVLIALLTFLDKPGSHPSESAETRETHGQLNKNP